MPAIDTGSTILDALKNLQVHLQAKKSTFGIRQVYRYPAYSEGVSGPAICLEVDTPTGIIMAQFGNGIEADWRITITITYYTTLTILSYCYDNVTNVMGELIEYLVENPSPNGFGNLLVDPGQEGPQIGNIQNAPAGTTLFGGTITVVLTHTRAHTVS